MKHYSPIKPKVFPGSRRLLMRSQGWLRVQSRRLLPIFLTFTLLFLSGCQKSSYSFFGRGDFISLNSSQNKSYAPLF